ncbi:hypothetical protein LPJ78_000863 [Coemansia sp. RSA 989]|nr:hypothetical protein BX667DRAFT_35683 [Coemansia mojavensis]KAJ1743516.1 hypothetical protein LPJ68_000894 [Coemansia sp. RSA 1086]KAJ1753803.1 hypothetical protein LPJ79_000090 [Coemansia sp. RSA 1821]KAJ1867628.1 hypothetical protein LPJ78_000863 [Coemansia sp. RSA 989]KAJ1875891.1 hypothetical protein LPJ55_000305 [Coemansia sp. RSA 990]KAJ2632878.1 hypothetical protein H4R22_000923 [Coemansia sp. RSA 1290]KAJ2653772.1 hypothetical protein IWW40_000056 [Coemansia sp. RSA 1250]KAJ267692
MGNTQSTEGEGGNRRHSGHHGQSGDGGQSGGLSHRLSRKSKPAETAAVPMPPMQGPPGSAAQQQLQSRNSRRRGPGVGPVDMISPVVGSPLPDSSVGPSSHAPMPIRGNRTATTAHAMPETIPQTLPNQSGLAQIMAARKITDDEMGRSPLSGISDDRIRWMADGMMGTSLSDQAAGLAGSMANGNDEFKAQKTVPTLIRWTEPGEQVYISGSFVDWQYKVKLHENDGMYGVVIDLPVGTHCLKFIVDGKWRCSNRFIIAPDDDGNLVNYFKVEDVIEEQGQEKEDNVEGLDATALSNSPPGEYGTLIPDLAKIARESANSRRNDPPLLPPHLNQVLLNSSEIRRDDPNVLPVPNHVVLNHLYACSIKDNVMAVSSTSRYRGKYMTSIYYKPVST